jgi:GTP-binding protein
MNFVDYARITVTSGDGGDGAKSFRREKYVPFGGPDGGDGGRGGSVILVADPALVTLYDFRAKPLYKARHGINGGPKNCTGHNGADCLIPVPLGTQVFSEDGQLLADMTQPGHRWVAARGGRGGLGNQHFVTSTNQAPKKIVPGEEGETRVLILELKMIADVGLVGLPNAGKSTLLAALTKAEPKIADYPFTTIHPNLGVLHFGASQRCVIADIPGLIEGAHHGAGLGDRFLRHVERTGVLIHLVAPPDGHALGDPVDPADLVYAYDLVSAELAAYSDHLATKPRTVVLSKTDLLTPDQAQEILEAFANHDVPIQFSISASDRSGLDDLVVHIEEMLQTHAAQREYDQLVADYPTVFGPGSPRAQANKAGEGNEADDEDGDVEMEWVQIGPEDDEGEGGSDEEGRDASVVPEPSPAADHPRGKRPQAPRPVSSTPSTAASPRRAVSVFEDGPSVAEVIARSVGQAPASPRDRSHRSKDSES